MWSEQSGDQSHKRQEPGLPSEENANEEDAENLFDQIEDPSVLEPEPQVARSPRRSPRFSHHPRYRRYLSAGGLQPEDEDEALASANLVDMDSTELDEVGEEAIAQMIARDPEMAALFGMDADGGSVAKSLSDTPSLLESQTVSEEELAQMFGDDTAAIADWKQFTDAGVSLPPFGNDNTHAGSGG